VRLVIADAVQRLAAQPADADARAVGFAVRRDSRNPCLTDRIRPAESLDTHQPPQLPNGQLTLVNLAVRGHERRDLLDAVLRHFLRVLVTVHRADAVLRLDLVNDGLLIATGRAP